MSEATWYYAAGGQQQQGPTTVEALVGMIQQGQLTSGDLVWREGMESWLPVSQVAELYGHTTAAPPSPRWQQPPAQSMPQALNPAAGYPAAAPGTPYYQDPSLANYGTTGKSYNGMAIASFVLSLVGLLFCGVVLGIVAIILGAVALNGMKTSGNRQGRRLSLAGVIIGVLDIIAGIVIVLFYVGMAAHRSRGF